MSCALLENAKHQYSQIRLQKIPALPIVQPTSNSLISMDSQNNIIRLSGLKRTLAECSTGISNEHEEGLVAIKMTKHIHLDKSSAISSESKPQPMNTMNLNVDDKSAQILASGVTILPSTAVNTIGVNRSITSGSNSHRGFCTETETDFVPTTTNNFSFGSTGRRQIFWNTANISTATKFVLDVQVNVAFGFGGDSKDRVASKHPELIRYLPDSDDREWLVSQQIIAPHNRNSRFLFLIYDEVRRLTQTYESYRQKAKVDLSLIMTFTVADFIVEKMKIFFIDLNIKSRGLITNSHTIDSQIKGNFVAQQPLNDNSSQLRNALLQGSVSPPSLSKVKITGKQPQGIVATLAATKQSLTSVTNVPNIVLRLPAVAIDTTAKVSEVGLTGASSVILASTKSKFTSVLSSSHATLTALLNNSKMSINTQTTVTSTATMVSTTTTANAATEAKSIISHCNSTQKSK